jgi:hypothetical protein
MRTQALVQLFFRIFDLSTTKMGNSEPQKADPPLRPPPRTSSPQPKTRTPRLTRDILLMYSLNHTEEYIAQYLRVTPGIVVERDVS